jgi:hypothetical protein
MPVDDDFLPSLFCISLRQSLPPYSRKLPGLGSTCPRQCSCSLCLNAFWHGRVVANGEMAHLPPLPPLPTQTDFEKCVRYHYYEIAAPVRALLDISTLKGNERTVDMLVIYDMPWAGLKASSQGDQYATVPFADARKFASQVRKDFLNALRDFKVKSRWLVVADFNASPSHTVADRRNDKEDAFQALTQILRCIDYATPLMKKVHEESPDDLAET